MKEKCKTKFKNSFKRTKAFGAVMSQGRRGGETALGIFAILLAMGALHSSYGFLPLWLVCILAVVLSAVVVLVLFGVLFLVFGTRRLIRALFIADLLLLTTLLISGCQGNDIPFCVLFSLLCTASLDILGRSVYVLIFIGDKRKTGLITGVVSLVLFLLLPAFLIPDGFSNGLVEKYAAAWKEVNQNVAQNEALRPGGSHPVESLTYGPDDSFDLQGGTYDLSHFAKRGFVNKIVLKLRFDYDLDAVPLSGKIWYPKDCDHCPVLFMIHGNHDVDTESYLGYEFLGEYLAGSGYTVVSVDENSCNSLTSENDARSILLLENMCKVLAWNEDAATPLYGKMDPDLIALAGHSRGGEAVSIATYFNDCDRYPDNGNIRFNYHFPIRSVIAIAPVCDQYIPAGKAVELEDVNYLLIHGLNDQDVSTVMGEKQYNLVRLSEAGNCFKSTVLINGANHGQFNTLWGRYDSSFPLGRVLDVHDLLAPGEQRDALCKLMKAFLDVTLTGDETELPLFYDIAGYRVSLPDTAYLETYRDSSYTCWFDFDEQTNPGVSEDGRYTLEVTGAKAWTEKRRAVTGDASGENCALAFYWGDDENNSSQPVTEGSGCRVLISMQDEDLSGKMFTFDAADMRENADVENAVPITCRVTFTDRNGQEAAAERMLMPSICVQLYKPDALLGSYEYKHQFATVAISPRDCEQEDGFDDSRIVRISIDLPDEAGDIEIDGIGSCALR